MASFMNYPKAISIIIKKYFYHQETVADPKFLPIIRTLGNIHGLAVHGNHPSWTLADRASEIIGSIFLFTFKPVYNDHPWDPKIVAVVDKWSLFRGHSCNKAPNWDLKMVVAIRRRSLAQV